MATLERPSEAAAHGLDDISELQATVPKPFPATSMRTTSSSRSPSASRLGGLMDKVKRAISKERDPMGDRTRTRDSTRDYESTIHEEDVPRGRSNPLQAITSSLTATTSRSTSRGRPTLSTGRGGAGNMLPTASITSGAEDDAVLAAARERAKSRSQSRGREEVVVGGRGGRGNMRSASRDKQVEQERMDSGERERERIVEKEVEERRAKKDEGRVWSTGRGGAGNMRPGATTNGNGSAAGGKV